MPEPQRSSSSTAATSSLCATCGKQMRLVSAQPDSRYINLDQHTYVCDCGQNINILIARKD